MISNKNFSENDVIDNPNLEDEIDLKQIFYALQRNKKLIVKFSLTLLILSGFIAFNTKRVWQGEFQIVLESDKSISSASVNPAIKSLVGISTEDNSLKTEVGILKSPSVLMNVFKFFKNEKALKNTSINTLKFKAWKNDALDIQLEKGTSILNIAFRDSDKDLILPVLNKISASYQTYSGRRRLRGIELGVDYYKEQIAIYKSKSVESSKKAQQFAIDQDLSVLKGESEIDREIPNAINIEILRVEAANQIKFLDQQIEEIENLKDDPSQLMYTASTIPTLDEPSLKLQMIDSRLERFRLSFRENDKKIQELQQERDFLIDLVKRQVKGYLIAQRSEAQSRLIATERPPGTLIKYKMLLGEATKDKTILNDLENKYRALLLEKARNEDPWELITTPTLLPYPVAPQRKKILALGLIGGIFLGSAASLVLEKSKDIVFSINEMESAGKWPLLAELTGNKKEFWQESLDLLESGPFSQIEGKIALLSIGEIDGEKLTQISESLNKLTYTHEIKIVKELGEAAKFPNLIIITGLGITRKQELIRIRKKLLLQRTSILGLITLT